LPPSWVRSYLTTDANGESIVVNVTAQWNKHLLYPGYVARTIQRNPDGTYTVNNFGEGDGLFQSPNINPDPDGTINDVWIDQTQQLIDACKCNL
jgi:hypothetical protein